MKQALKYGSILLLGALLSAGLLYFYSQNIQKGVETSSNPSSKSITAGESLFTLISGDVFIIREGESLAAQVGDIIYPGDQIKVVDDSFCQIQFADRAQMRLTENSVAKVLALLGKNQQADIQTELLTGSMIYKVNRLSESENLQIKIEETLFRVKGTEFLLSTQGGRETKLAVLSGQVDLFQLNDDGIEILLNSIKKMQKVDLSDSKPSTEGIQGLSSEETKQIEEQLPRATTLKESDYTYLTIEATPSNAEIFIDGISMGDQGVKGFFLRGAPLLIRAEKRGYLKAMREVTPTKDLTEPIQIFLTPLSIEQTLEAEREPPINPIEELKKNQSEDLKELEEQFKGKLEDISFDIKKLEDDKKALKQENKNLEEELLKSQKERAKLKALIQQIQNLASE